MSCLENYITHIQNQVNQELAAAVKKTADDIVSQYISTFSYAEHIVSLLIGDVQSGKTSHMFAVMCAAVDEGGFGNFVLLTTDNTLLQQQTFKRAQRDLKDFCVCDECDYMKFVDNDMKKPAVIVLKKNSSVLKQWRDNFSSTKFCAGNPLFIIDDEADASSLNTLVNKKEQSAINKYLSEIKRTTSSSIYMQVTGTPQSIFLQTEKSGWKPKFIYYFQLGKGYLGGNFFFNEEHKNIIFTDDEEASEVLTDDEYPENGLRAALITHLITSAHIMLNGGTVSNFLIHPSVKTELHQKFAEKVGNYLNDIALNIDEEDTKNTFKVSYMDLKSTCDDLDDFDKIYEYIKEILDDGDAIKHLILNSNSTFVDNSQYETGINVIVGGNSLGRGVTFPQLQTIYYCRLAKKPQADTMWQHARMFGYDRVPGLIRIYMPPLLFKLFSDINMTNNNIISQIKKAKNGTDIKITYPKEINPTRKNVIDKKALAALSGGVNYFPFYPTNKGIALLDDMLSPFKDDTYSVNMNLVVKLLEQMDSEKDDWKAKRFVGYINTFISENPMAQAKLIVRRERNIAKGTGTLLSPNDRTLGESFPDDIVLTLYKVTGEKGWNGEKLWIPNIKLPAGRTYYGIEE